MSHFPEGRCVMYQVQAYQMISSSRSKLCKCYTTCVFLSQKDRPLLRTHSNVAPRRFRDINGICVRICPAASASETIGNPLHTHNNTNISPRLNYSCPLFFWLTLGTAQPLRSHDLQGLSALNPRTKNSLRLPYKDFLRLCPSKCHLLEA